MKRILFALVLVVLMSGCTRNVDDKKNTTDGNSTGTNDSANNNQNYGNTTTNWYDEFESGLKNKNITYTAKSSLDPSAIGGAEGYRYMTANGNIDIYRFEDGEEYDKIVKEKKLTLDGQSKTVEVNDHMIIVSDGLSDDVLNVFKGLNKETFE